MNPERIHVTLELGGSDKDWSVEVLGGDLTWKLIRAWEERTGQILDITVKRDTTKIPDRATAIVMPTIDSTPVILDESETARAMEYRNLSFKLPPPLSEHVDALVTAHKAEREKMEKLLNTPVSEVMAKVEPPASVGGRLPKCDCQAELGMYHSQNCALMKFRLRDAMMADSQEPPCDCNAPDGGMHWSTCSVHKHLLASQEPPAMDLPDDSDSRVRQLQAMNLPKMPPSPFVDEYEDITIEEARKRHENRDRLDPPQEPEPPKRVNWKEFL